MFLQYSHITHFEVKWLNLLVLHLYRCLLSCLYHFFPMQKHCPLQALVLSNSSSNLCDDLQDQEVYLLVDPLDQVLYIISQLDAISMHTLYQCLTFISLPPTCTNSKCYGKYYSTNQHQSYYNHSNNNSNCFISFRRIYRLCKPLINQSCRSVISLSQVKYPL